MVVAPTSPPTTVSSNNGMVNLGIYSIISAVYLVTNYHGAAPAPADASNPSGFKINVIAIIFIITIWLTQFIMTFISLQQQCKTPNYWLAAWASFATWLGLFVPMFVCLEYMYAWLQPFGNTFGYWIIKLNGLVQFMNSILRNSGNDKVQQYLDYMKEDPWAMFSMLTTYDNAPKIIRASDQFDVLNDKYINASLVPDAKNTFINYVRLKESVAKFIFYVLTLNLMADFTFIITQEHKPCTISRDNTVKAAVTPPPPKPAIVYKTSE